MPFSRPTASSISWLSTRAPSSASTGTFQLANYNPASQATVWQYGETQDTAQSQTANGNSALADFTTNLNVSGSTFSYSFPAYSMTVLVLSKASAGSGPVITQPAAASPNPVTGKTTVLSVTATDPLGTSGLTYTWTTTGTPPAAGQLQRQWYQRGPEHDGHVFGGGFVHVSGHRDRPERV